MSYFMILSLILKHGAVKANCSRNNRLWPVAVITSVFTKILFFLLSLQLNDTTIPLEFACMAT